MGWYFSYLQIIFGVGYFNQIGKVISNRIESLSNPIVQRHHPSIACVEDGEVEYMLQHFGNLELEVE